MKYWATGLLLVVGLPLSVAGEDAVPRERPTVSPSMRSPHLKPERAFQTAGPYRYGNSYSGYGYDYFGYGAGLGLGWPYLPILGEVGRSTVWIAGGSQGYLGGGFSTRQPIEDTSFVYGFSMSREQGETWYKDLDYKLTSMSPWLEWHGESISVYAGFSKQSLEYNGK